MSYSIRQFFISLMILVIANASHASINSTLSPFPLPDDGSCSITGHRLSCYRSNHAANIMMNLSRYVSSETSIREISVIECGLTSIPDAIWKECPSLQSLDLSGNQISSFKSQIRHESLKHMNLSRNGMIRDLELGSIFHNYPSLFSLDLSSNHILNLGNAKPLITQNDYRLILRESNVSCSKNISWFLEWAAAEMSKPSLLIVAPDARCASGSMEGVPLISAFVSLNSLSHPICGRCDCFFKPSLHVNCSSRKMTEFPTSLPVQTKVVDLGHNQIKDISLSPAWVSVIYLHLKNNQIESLEGLDGNAFARNIRSLSLESNRLTEVEARVLKQLNVDQISLKDNPWRCDCNTIAFQLWIQDHSTQIKDMDQIRCASPPTPGQVNGLDADIHISHQRDPLLFGRRIYRIFRSDLCPQPEKGVAIHFYDLASAAMAFLTVVIIVKLVYDWWWQRRTGQLPRFFKLNI